MIENVPDAEELREVSLRLYFKAWREVVDILVDWTRIMAARVPDWVEQSGTYRLTEEDVSSEEWLDYLEKAQGDLQGIYTLIQQSQEIGLKAQICEVSPYLLLKRPDQRPEPIRPSVWDFTDFATIDAQHLPRTHDTFRKPLSKGFVEAFEELRRSRNKINHLGIHRDRIAPHRIITLLQQQFTELYPGRRWFDDRLRNLSLHRWANYGEESDLALVHGELDAIFPVLTATQFRWLMGHGPAVPRFQCHHCYIAGSFELSITGPCNTAYLDGSAIRCAVCDEITPAKRGTCWDPTCKSQWLSNDPQTASRCLVCDYTAEEWEERVAADTPLPKYPRFELPAGLLMMRGGEPD